MGWEETQGEGGGVGRALPMTAHEESKQYTGESKQYTDMLHEGIGKTLSKDVSCDSPKEREGLDLTLPPSLAQSNVSIVGEPENLCILE